MVCQPLLRWWTGWMGAPFARRYRRIAISHLPKIRLQEYSFMKRSRKKIFVGILCGLAAMIALIWPALPMAGGHDRLSAMPLDGPDFQSVPMELTPADQKFLAGASAVQRIVRPRHGQPFMLTVIDGSGNRHAVHDPTYCLAGGGWKIIDKQQMAMSSGQATRISMEKDGVKMEALWFFDDGREQFTSPFTYWSRASLRRATRGLSGPEPLLIMLRIPPGESADWKRISQVILPSLGFR